MEQIDTKVKLINWLKEKTECKVYTDSVQSAGDGVFKVKGTSGSKPDLLIVINGDLGDWVIAVEVKPGSSKQLTDALFQIVRYAGQYLTEDAEYLINEKPTKVHHFVICTVNSPLGYLFDKEKELGVDCFVRGSYFQVPERPMTFSYWRILYRLWQETISGYLEKTTYFKKNTPKLGILTSKLEEDRFGILNTKEPILISDNKVIPLKFN